MLQRKAADRNDGITVQVLELRPGPESASRTTERLATVADDVARLRAGPSDAQVRYRFVTGRWPDNEQLELCIRPARRTDGR